MLAREQGDKAAHRRDGASDIPSTEGEVSYSEGADCDVASTQEEEPVTWTQPPERLSLERWPLDWTDFLRV